MTFYEAALRILESEGRPLTFLEITEKSIAENLLSHVGKTPELTMLSRLAAMARRTRDRKVVVTAKDTFALADWALPEDAEALALTGVMEAHPEDSLPPLRPVERHPEPRTENVRSAGRGTERGKRRRDEEEEGRGGRRRRFPPMPEVVFEILSESEQSLRPEQLLERAKSKELAGEDVTVEALLTALLEDNQRRIDAGRRPQFSLSKETGEVTLERAGAPSEAPPLELQAAFAAALGIPLEDGRPVLPKAGVAGAATPEAQADAALLTTARTAVKDARKAVARAVRKRLGELDVGTFEKSVVKMMHALGFRELKVAKRSKEGPLLTARKREGSVDLRFAIRMLKGTPSIERKAVQELRKDLGHYSAQVGLLACAGDVRGDARTEAQASGSLVMLWCGDALGEKFLEAKAAVTVTTVELYDVDERFFEVAKLEAEEAQKRREERQREKQARAEEGEEGAEETGTREAGETESTEEAPTPSRREERQRAREERRRERQARAEQARADKAEAAPAPVAVAPTEAVAPAALSEEEQGEEGEDEGEDEDLEAASAFVAGGQPEGGAPGETAGERKRRRRRRRGRRGRGGRGPEGAAGTPGAEGAAGVPGAEGAVGAPGTPPGEAVAAASAAVVGGAPGEGAATAEPVAGAAAPATASEEAAASLPSEGMATPGEAMRTAAEWQSPFPSVESSAPAEAQRTAAEEYARVAAEKAESAAEGARPPSEPAPSNEPPPSGSGSPEGGTT
jgi:hypothetical protein